MCVMADARKVENPAHLSPQDQRGVLEGVWCHYGVSLAGSETLGYCILEALLVDGRTSRWPI